MKSPSSLWFYLLDLLYLQFDLFPLLIKLWNCFLSKFITSHTNFIMMRMDSKYLFFSAVWEMWSTLEFFFLLTDSWRWDLTVCALTLNGPATKEYVVGILAQSKLWICIWGKIKHNQFYKAETKSFLSYKLIMWQFDSYHNYN